MKLSTLLVAVNVLAAGLAIPAQATSVIKAEAQPASADAKTDIFTIVARHDKPSDALTYDTTFHAIETGWTGAAADSDIGYVTLHYKNDPTSAVHSYVGTVSSAELRDAGCSKPYGTITLSPDAATGAVTGVTVPADPATITQNAYLHIMKGSCKLQDGLYHIDVTVKTYTS